MVYLNTATLSFLVLSMVCRTNSANVSLSSPSCSNDSCRTIMAKEGQEVVFVCEPSNDALNLTISICRTWNECDDVSNFTLIMTTQMDGDSIICSTESQRNQTFISNAITLQLLVDVGNVSFCIQPTINNIVTGQEIGHNNNSTGQETGHNNNSTGQGTWYNNDVSNQNPECNNSFINQHNGRINVTIEESQSLWLKCKTPPNVFPVPTIEVYLNLTNGPVTLATGINTALHYELIASLEMDTATVGCRANNADQFVESPDTLVLEILYAPRLSISLLHHLNTTSTTATTTTLSGHLNTTISATTNTPTLSGHLDTTSTTTKTPTLLDHLDTDTATTNTLTLLGHLDTTTTTASTTTFLQCKARGRPNNFTFLKWKHYVGDQLVREVEGYKTDSGSTYNLNISVDLHTAGQYICTASNGIGLGSEIYQSKSYELRPDSPQLYSKSMTKQNATVADYVELYTIYICYSYCNVTWYKGTEVLQFTTEYSSIYNTHNSSVQTPSNTTVLKLISVQQSDQGVYNCTMCNNHSCVESYVQLNVDVLSGHEQVEPKYTEVEVLVGIGIGSGIIVILIIIIVILVIILLRRSHPKTVKTTSMKNKMEMMENEFYMSMDTKPDMEIMENDLYISADTVTH